MCPTFRGACGRWLRGCTLDDLGHLPVGGRSLAHPVHPRHLVHPPTWLADQDDPNRPDAGSDAMDLERQGDPSSSGFVCSCEGRSTGRSAPRRSDLTHGRIREAGDVGALGRPKDRPKRTLGALRAPVGDEASRRTKILAFAYACEPQKGSEPGAGWGWARLLSRLGDTWIITRENNRESIEAELISRSPRPDLCISSMWTCPSGLGHGSEVSVASTSTTCSGRELPRGVRVSSMPRRVRSGLAPDPCQRVDGFGCGVLGPPFIYGPVGGGIRPPWRLARALRDARHHLRVSPRRRSDRRALRESLGQERMA